MSLPERHGRARIACLGLAVTTIIAGCGADAAAPGSPALVLLRQQLRRETTLAVSRVQQVDDSTLRVVLEEGTKRTLDTAERDSLARRAASRVVRFWPDPTLREIEVIVGQQVRLGPFTYRSGEVRYAFDAAAVAPPPALPAEPSALVIPSWEPPPR
jgi:hypothetical protein